jgi:hypothetical protein
MIFFTSDDYIFIPENVAIVYKNINEKKSVFGWILFSNQTYAGSYVVEHDTIPTDDIIKEMLEGLCYELKIQKKGVEGKEVQNG